MSAEVVTRAAWWTRHRARLSLAEKAATEPGRAPELLSAWAFSNRPGLVAPLVDGLEVPPSPEVDALVGWAFAEAPPAGPETGPAVVFDGIAMRGAREGTGMERRTAALLLLARLGEEVHRREHRAWAEERWRPGERDAAARRFWDAALRGERAIEMGRAFRSLWGEQVGTAFRAACQVLRLPPEVGRRHAADALEQLDFLVLGAHRELGARVAETRGEPVGALAACLPPAAIARVEGCAGGRRTWERARSLLRCETDSAAIALGSDLAVFLRLLGQLGRGRAAPHPRGLPGWGVVHVNRAHLRGRLRAVAVEYPDALRAGLLALDALHHRTASAVVRFAWDWAFREARHGFGFDLGRLGGTPCPPPEARAPRPAMDEDAARTVLLLLVGRGCWDALGAWLGGQGRGLGGTFYRHLSRAAPALGGVNGHRYDGLADWLRGGGLEASLPVLRAVAARVAAVPSGRGMKGPLHRALLPDWDPAVVALPDHHLPGFRRAFADFLEATDGAHAQESP